VVLLEKGCFLLLKSISISSRTPPLESISQKITFRMTYVNAANAKSSSWISRAVVFSFLK
jgi:hypothetical protein